MIKWLLNILAIILLLLNGLGAIYGGVNLIAYPDGSSLQLSLSWLKYSPFSNYLVPGIILLVSNGLLSLAVIAGILMRAKISSLLVLLQGVVLTGWIIVQMLLIHTIYFLHVVMGTIGILLMVTGWLLQKLKQSNG